MSKRLQIILDDNEWSEVGRVARASGLTVSEWVRQVLREARRRRPDGDPATKLAVVRAAAAHSFPTADIDEMLGQIEAGYEVGPGAAG